MKYIRLWKSWILVQFKTFEVTKDYDTKLSKEIYCIKKQRTKGVYWEATDICWNVYQLYVDFLEQLFIGWIIKVVSIKKDCFIRYEIDFIHLLQKKVEGRWSFRGGRATVSDKLESLYPMLRDGYLQLGATQGVTPQYLYFLKTKSCYDAFSLKRHNRYLTHSHLLWFYREEYQLHHHSQGVRAILKQKPVNIALSNTDIRVYYNFKFLFELTRALLIELSRYGV